MAEFERASARNDVINWMDDSIAMHERAIRDLNQRKQSFLEAFDKPEAGLMTAVDHVGAFVNDMQNGVLRNVRFDVAASVAAKVANVINGTDHGRRDRHPATFSPMIRSPRKWSAPSHAVNGGKR